MSSSREPQQTATESGGHSLQSVDRRRRVQPWPRFLLPKCDEDLSSTSLFAVCPVSASPSVGRYLRERRAQADQQRTQNDRGSAATGSREGEHSSGHREARERSDGDRERGAKRSEAQHRFAGLRSAQANKGGRGAHIPEGPPLRRNCDSYAWSPYVVGAENLRTASRRSTSRLKTARRLAGQAAPRENNCLHQV